MGEQRFQPRPPGYLDVDLTGDGHGHHVAGTPFIYSHNWHLLHGAKSKFRLKPPGVSSGTRSRHTRVLSGRSVTTESSSTVSGPEGTFTSSGYSKHLDSVVGEMAGDDGVKLQTFHLDVDEWKTRWDAADPSEKSRLTEEMEAHVKLVNDVLHAAHEDVLDTHVGVKVASLKKFDEALKKTAAGRAIIKVRDKIVTEGAYKKFASVRKFVSDHGLDSAGHILTGLAAAVIVSHLLGAPLLAPVLHHFVEAHVGMLSGDRIIEGVVAACVSMHVTKKVMAPLEKLTSRERKIEKAKKRLATLTVETTKKA